ncbi:hypothetical protein N7490_005113 [Penicillium lividum]|nr:hypothetical protein N7490_005113 [Penicillium lividum]
MVFLRLEVRVYPPEQLPGFLRSILPGKRPESDETNKQKPFAGLLLTLEKPEDLSMGDLGRLIKQKWEAIHPNSPLVIKKLLDDTMPAVDIEVETSVQDVFVDRGKARADGHDQRGIVRVIQKPCAHAPERLPSVDLDFEAASESFSRKRKQQTPESDVPSKEPRLEGQTGRSTLEAPTSPGSTRRRDLGPSWTSPHRRPSNVSPPNGRGLGLGVTSSPPKRAAQDRQRRVSFQPAGDEDTPRARKGPQSSIIPSSQVSVPPSSQVSGMVYPADLEMIQELQKRCENEEREMNLVAQLLQDPKTHASLRPTLLKMSDIYDILKGRNTGNGRSKRRKSGLERVTLEALRIELQEREEKLAVKLSPPEIEESAEICEISDSDREGMGAVNGNGNTEKEKIDRDEEMVDTERVVASGELQPADNAAESTDESESESESGEESTDESEAEEEPSAKPSVENGEAEAEDEDEDEESADDSEAKAEPLVKPSVENREAETEDEEDDEDEESADESEAEAEPSVEPPVKNGEAKAEPTIDDSDDGSDNEEKPSVDGAEVDGEDDEDEDEESATGNSVSQLVDDEAGVESEEEEDEEEEESTDEGSDQEDDIKSKPEQQDEPVAVEVPTSSPVKLPEISKVQPQLVQDSSSEESESEGELDASFSLPKNTSHFTPVAPAPAAKSIEQLSLSQKTTPRVTPRKTLKDLLSDQKAKQAARAKQPPVQPPKVTKSIPRGDIFEVSDSSDDQHSSDSDGDILPNGNLAKRPKAWSR